MSNWDAIHSSARHNWETPEDLMAELRLTFDFELDVAASLKNAKADRWFSSEDNGLMRSWKTSENTWAWCNPPYGRDIGLWFKKAASEASQGARVVLLAFACTDTKWFEFAWANCTSIVFLTGRIRFIDPETGERGNAAPKGSALYIFDGTDDGYQGVPTVELFRPAFRTSVEEDKGE